jgi:hypothetical protein
LAQQGQAEAALASRGGLSGGARERMMKSNMRDANLAKQGIALQGNINRIGFQNTALDKSTAAQAQNMQNLIQDNQLKNAGNLYKYGQKMQGFGAGKTADALASGGNKTGTVLCTALYHHGLLPKSIYEADSKYGRLMVTAETMENYVSWAKYPAALMTHSYLFSLLVYPVVASWSYHIAHRVGAYHRGNIIGAALETFGIPLSNFVGKVIKFFTKETRVCGEH